MRLRFVAPFAVAALAAATARAAVITVWNTADAGPGSLRDAITQANASPGRDEIRGEAADPPEIKLASPLPHVTEEVVIQNIWISGTAAGATDGLVIDADDVRLDNVYVSKFDGNGVVVNGRRASLSKLSSDYNRGDGIVLAGSGASGGVGATGNRGVGIRVDGADARLGASASGNGGDGIRALGDRTVLEDPWADRNSGNGVTLSPTSTLDWLSGGCNGGLLVDVRGDGPTANDVPDVDGVVNAPQITSATVDGTITGTLAGVPNTTYLLRVYAREWGAFPWDYCGGSGGAWFRVTTDATGVAHFRHGTVFQGYELRVGVYAQRLDANGIPRGNSEVSPLVEFTPATSSVADLALTLVAPQQVAAGEQFRVLYNVTNKGPATANYAIASTTSGARAVGPCCSSAVGPGETLTLAHTFAVTGAAGSNVHISAAMTVEGNHYVRITDPDLSNNSAAIDIRIVQSVPTLSPIALALLGAVVAALAVARIRS